MNDAGSNGGHSTDGSVIRHFYRMPVKIWIWAPFNYYFNTTPLYWKQTSSRSGLSSLRFVAALQVWSGAFDSPCCGCCCLLVCFLNNGAVKSPEPSLLWRKCEAYLSANILIVRLECYMRQFKATCPALWAKGLRNIYRLTRRRDRKNKEIGENSRGQQGFCSCDLRSIVLLKKVTIKRILFSYGDLRK